MGSKVVTIEPDYPRHMPWTRYFPKSVQVIFTWSRPRLEKGKRSQTVTFCCLRRGIKRLGGGTAIENPNDERNDMEGFHWAFKRSINSMIYHLEHKTRKQFSENVKKQVDKAFRQALWEVMNGKRT